MDIALTREGAVAVLTWNAGENRINLDSLARLNELLDEVEAVEGPQSLVLTGTGKFFCNGLDLERFADVITNRDVVRAQLLANRDGTLALLNALRQPERTPQAQP